MLRKAWTLYLGGLLTTCLACSSSNDDKSGQLEFNGAGGTGNDGGGAGGGYVGGQFNTGTGSTNGAGGALQQCAGQAFKAEAMPVDMYVMFDQSSSMNEIIPGTATSWWTVAAQAVDTFVSDPRAHNGAISVGIQYFPLGGVEPASCDVMQYTNPDVEIAVLPGNSQAIIDSVARHVPTTFTPSRPALQGAVDHMTAWAPQHPGRAPVVVFVTDGFPTECDPKDISDVAAVAKAAFTGPNKIRTFVVGFDAGLGLENLDQIADAGGTGKAFIIKNGDIGAQFVDAMLGISSTPLQCDFDMPPPPSATEVVNPLLVSVTYTSNASQTPVEIPKIGSLGSCQINGNNGWYYDSESNPTKILVCPGTCDKFAAGVVKIVYGCTPIGGVD